MKPGAMAEQLVAQIERVLGQSATVTTNERLADRHGTLREADVCVRFTQGGRGFVVVVEIRDRDAVDDIQWIDQIDGKWRDAGYRVVAVSSSGFSHSAVDKARRLRIELLTFRETDTVSWAIGLSTDHLSVVQPVVSMPRVHIHLAGDTQPSPELLTGLPVSPMATVFRNKTGGSPTLLHLWENNIRSQVHPLPYCVDEPHQCHHVRLEMTEHEPLWLVHNGLEIPIAAIEMWAECWAEEVQQVPFRPAREYAEADEGNVRAGAFETQQPIMIGGREFFAGLVYVPGHESDEGASISLVLRDASTSDGEEP